MSRRDRVLRQARAGRNPGLLVTASYLTLAAAALAPTGAARAAALTAGDEASLRAAILAANASVDASSTITLTGAITISDPALLPTATKQLVLDTGGFTVSAAVLKSSSNMTLQGVGQLRLAGVSTVGGDVKQDAGTLRVDGGAELNSGGLTRVDAGGTLVVDGAGSLVRALTFLPASNAGTATVRIQNGGVVQSTATSSSLSWGNALGAIVDLSVTGAGSRYESNHQIGIAAAAGAGGTILVSGGGVMTAPRINLGSPTQVQATPPSMQVDGGGSSVAVSGVFAVYKGNLDVTGGGAVTANSFQIGAASGTGRLLVSGAGSSVTSTGTMSLAGTGANSNGIITLTNGGVLHAASTTLGGSVATRVGVLSIGGAEAAPAAAAGLLDTPSVTFGVGGGRLNFNHTETNYTFATPITGPGAINQVAGVTHLTGNNSAFTGTTTVSGGDLRVDGTLGGATSTVAVSAGGRLGGSGTIGGNVTVTGGIVAPGNSPGTLTINGNLTLDAASTLNFEFGQANVPGGTFNDLIKVGGNLTLDGTINVTASAPSFGPGLYRVIDYTGTLTDNGLSIGATPGGSSFAVQTSIAGQVNLANTAGQPLNIWDGAGARNNSDVAGGSGVWQGGTGNDNWTLTSGALNAAWTPSAFAVFTKTGGTVTVDPVSGGAVNASGMQFAVDGYTLTGGTIGLVGAANVWVGDGTANSGAMTATINSTLGGTGQLIKTDAGTLVLTGANTYSGATQVNGGVLRVDGDQTAAIGATAVNSGGALGGGGTVGGNVTVNAGGSLAPGASAGTLTINGALALSAGSTLQMEFGQAGTAGGALNDLIVVNGALTLDGVLNVTQSAGGAFGDGIYRVIDYTGALTNNGLNVGALPSGAGTIQTSIANQINLVVTGSGGGGGGGGGGGDPPTPPPPPTFNFWDGGGQGADGAITGGNGTWRAAGDQGWTNTVGAINGAYANGGFAIFAGQGGLVAVDNSQGAVSASGLQFAADGYRIVGETLTLSGSDVTLRVGDGTTPGAAFTATVDVQLTGAARLVKTDAGTLVLTAANSYAGGTAIQGGQLVGSAASFGAGAIVDNAALILDQAADATFGNAIDGTGTFSKRGAGRLTYTGAATLSGATIVDAGVLAVNGSLAGSAVTVRRGATLSGSGAVGAVTLDTGGIIAPAGDTVGVLTLNGALGQAAGSVYRVQLDPSLGASDRLMVAGAATLSGGAVLEVSRLGSVPYSLGAVYTVLHAEGGVTGTYSLTGDLGPISAFLGLRDSYDAQNVYLTVAQVRPLPDAGVTPNQVAAGGGADTLPATNPVRQTLVGLPTDASAQAAFDQISGEPNASAKGVMIAQSDAVRDAALARLRDAACGLREGEARDAGCVDVSDRAAGWAQALGGWGKFDGGRGTAGVDHDTAGFLTGLDLPLGAWRVGGFAGYSRTSWDVDARRASGDSDDYHAGVYGGRAWDRLSLKLGGGYTRHDVSARRSVAFATISERLDAKYDAGALQAFGELGYRFGGAGVSWEPFANVAHVRLRTDGLAETGGATALTSEADTMQTTVATVGVRPATQVDLGPARATLRALVGWRRAFGDVDPTATHRFAGGAAFRVEGAALARDAAVLEAGADFAFGRGGVASVTYGGQFGDGVTDQRIRVDVRLTF